MATQTTSIPGSGYGNPYLDALIWGCGWTGGPISVFFGSGTDPLGIGNGSPWLDYEIVAFRSALQLLENVCNIDFQEVDSYAEADIAWWRAGNDQLGDTTLGFHEVPDETIAGPIHGYFNIEHFTWTEANLAQGGYAFITVVHELGHAVGLAHPHDGGSEPDATVFPGVTSPFDTGDDGLNQGIWTTMGYNDGWNQQTAASFAYGWQGSFMAFDVAALQAIYGVNTTYNAGNNVYALPGVNGSGTFWSCIWDAGGTDVVSAEGLGGSCIINLNAAPLIGPNAGGYVSYQPGILGGFTIANGVVIENAIGGNGHDNITGNIANNLLLGNAGADFLDGGFGEDTLVGETGDDTYVIDVLGDVIVEAVNEGSDVVRASIDYALSDGLETLVLVGTAPLSGSGNSADNALYGNEGNNSLSGAGGNDSFNGGYGADTMIGGLGNDRYYVENSSDAVVEEVGQGNESVDSAVDWTLAEGIENLALISTSLVGHGNELDNSILSTYGNVVYGHGGDDTLAAAGCTLYGGDGDDILDAGRSMYGGVGNDYYYLSDKYDYIEEQSDQGIDSVQVTFTYELPTNVENVVLIGFTAYDAVGNDLDNVMTGNDERSNTLVGNAGADWLMGKIGNDTLEGGAGDDTLDGGEGVDRLAGVDGDDTYVIHDPTDLTDAIVEGLDQGIDTIATSISCALGDNLERLLLTGIAWINGTGNALANTIIGNSGANRLDGGAGADTLEGGGGADTYWIDDGGDIIVESADDAIDSVRSSVSIVLITGLDWLALTGDDDIDGIGNDLANIIDGNDGNNVINGGGGADTLYGRSGNDRFVIDDARDAIGDPDGAGDDTVESAITFSLAASSIETLILTGEAQINGIGNELDNTLHGNAASNRLVGGKGDDLIDGGGGSDILIGEQGNDTYFIDDSTDVVVESANFGIDRVVAKVDYILAANIENLELIGPEDAGATGNNLANKIVGSVGHNMLDGKAGADTMQGGAGDDTYYVDNIGDVILEQPDQGFDLAYSTVSHALADNVESLILQGSAATRGSGNAADNQITGTSGANTLNGAAGTAR
jgi:Ca2+-binding RTX toxin-like protein